MRIGIDAGGTFTDFVILRDDGRVESFKVPSNPHNPAQVILAGLKRAEVTSEADIVHGSTVATNALLERKGVRTALVTTAGFEDLTLIGRQNRPELYNLTPRTRVPLAPRELCFGVAERAHFDGSIERAPAAAALRTLVRRLSREGVESVAVCLLHSYRNPRNERAVERALAGRFYLAISNRVCPEFREFERASTTLVNAYVGPLMAGYLEELQSHCRQRVWIMQSNGGAMTAREASRFAVRTILSGPAGGVVGAVETARLSGYARILAFDMGGTSTDVSLSSGEPTETAEAYVDGLPIRVPMLDIHTVGAGGGSLARVDAGGLLRVGPASAGADPGPACYGKGVDPTVTDAHVVLGRIGEEQFLGGEMKIDSQRAARAVERIAAHLRTDLTKAAAGIIRVANANMERAIRLVSVERGYDPRDFALLAFGGCGGLHACEIAEALDIRTVLVPFHAGALSALGMLLCDRVRDYADGVVGRKDVERRLEALACRARRDLPGAKIQRFADLRYAGQSYELTVPWTRGLPAAAFHREHQRVYGYSNPDRAVETVAIRVRARQKVERPRLTVSTGLRGEPSVAASRLVFVDGRWRRAALLARGRLYERPLKGPVLIVDYGSTTLAPGGWTVRIDQSGMLILQSRRA